MVGYEAPGYEALLILQDIGRLMRIQPFAKAQAIAYFFEWTVPNYRTPQHLPTQKITDWHVQSEFFQRRMEKI